MRKQKSRLLSGHSKLTKNSIAEGDNETDVPTYDGVHMEENHSLLMAENFIQSLMKKTDKEVTWSELSKARMPFVSKKAHIYG